MSDLRSLDDYSLRGLQAAERALFLAWDALENFREDLVVVGGLAIHYHTRERKHPVFPSTATLDVDFGISLGTDAGMAASVRFALMMAGYKENEEGRMVAATEEGNLYIDFLTEHPPAETGSRNVSEVRASICPGINRALADRKFVEIEGIDRLGDLRTFRVPICGIGPLLVLKLNAFAKRDNDKKAKDAYDLLVAVSSYPEGPEATIRAFHEESRSGNPAFPLALETLKKHFLASDRDGPRLASAFRYGTVDPGREGARLGEDLVTIALELSDLR